MKADWAAKERVKLKNENAAYKRTIVTYKPCQTVIKQLNFQESLQFWEFVAQNLELGLLKHRSVDTCCAKGQVWKKENLV